VIQSFGDRDTEALFNREQIKKLHPDLLIRARSKLLIIHAAVDEDDLRVPPRTIEFMKPLGITAYRLSKEIKVQQTAVSQIINGNRKITVDMALRLSRYFGNSAQFWLNLQNHYDLESEIEKKEYLIKEIVPYSMHAAEKTAVYA